MQIEWKSVFYDGVYTRKLISNTGLMWCEEKEELCRAYDNGAGYLAYRVGHYKNKNDDWQPRLVYIHRLVATYFLDNPYELPQVNHKDCDKSNNHVSNLEWISRRGNIDHAHAAGRMTKRSNLGQGVMLTEQEVVECYTRVKLGEGISAVARSMNKSRTTISSIINKRSRAGITDKIDRELNDTMGLH